MTQQEFRRLTREDLMDIIYELQKKLAAAEQENEQLREKLAARELKIENAGSIAEAALALSGVFEAAQAAADQYLEQTRRASEQARAACDEAKRLSDKLIADAQRRASAIAAGKPDGVSSAAGKETAHA